MQQHRFRAHSAACSSGLAQLAMEKAQCDVRSWHGDVVLCAASEPSDPTRSCLSSDRCVLQSMCSGMLTPIVPPAAKPATMAATKWTRTGAAQQRRRTTAMMDSCHLVKRRSSKAAAAAAVQPTCVRLAASAAAAHDFSALPSTAYDGAAGSVPAGCLFGHVD